MFKDKGRRGQGPLAQQLWLCKRLAARQSRHNLPLCPPELSGQLVVLIRACVACKNVHASAPPRVLFDPAGLHLPFLLGFL